MTYQVLARKWRPKTFADLIGQDIVVRTLTHALTHQRLHHAYLFTGTRGVGKTTLGRLIAKCMNCEQGISPTPCGQCSICLAIDAGHFVDLIEVDAASRTKVEDTRDLLDNVQYAPAQGRFKIYLIDEVHMLSGHSFNALLKTLEEPPSHIKFLFATTDPDRLPDTVLSRCIQFHLKNMAPDIIAPYLAHILQEEKINFEQTALDRIAYAAEGSMRDALSLLDQAIAFGQGALLEADVKTMLGSLEHDDLMILLEAIAQQDAAQLAQALQQLSLYHCDYAQAAQTLLSLLHHLALHQVFPTLQAHFFTQHHDKLTQLAKQFSAEELQLLYQIALLGRRDLSLAPTPKSGFEMLLLRLFTFKPAFTEQAASPSPKQTPVAHMTRTPSSTAPADTPTFWDEVLPKLQLNGLTQLLAQHCTLQTMSETHLDLWLSPSQQPLLSANAQTRLAEALSKHLGKSIKLNIKLGEKNLSTPAEKKRQHEKQEQQSRLDKVTKDENLQALLSTFDGQIQAESIKDI